jgi:predicted metal-dependent peptidase
VRRRWEVACDHAVNLMLREDGLRLPDWALADPAFAGLAAEEIYPLVPDDTPDAPRDRHGLALDHGGDGLVGWRGGRRAEDGLDAVTPTPAAGRNGAAAGEQADAQEDLEDNWNDAGNAPRRHRPAGQGGDPGADATVTAADLEQLWRSRVAAAAQAAREAGRLGDSWLRRLERLIEPALPWRALLARHVMSAARDDYSFTRPRRRDGDALLPRLSSGALRLVAVLDTSGSITDAELSEFTGELEALKSQVQAELVIHACDERLAPDGPWRFAAWEPVRLPEHIPGGGGTRFTPVFEWVEREGVRPDLLVVFTDAQGEFPAQAPDYAVLWLVKGRAPVPFGERVALN